MNNFIIIIGGHVVHSYGRLVHHEHVITRGDQLLPPGDVAGPGRMDCIRTAPENASFEFDGSQPPSSSVNQSVKNDDRMATLLFNQSYLSMDSFNNVEGFCRGAERNSFFYLFISPGKYLQFNTHSTMTCLSISTSSDALLFFYHSLTGKLPNVTIMSAASNTTDARIVLNNIPSGIGRVIVGYERHDLGVTLQGEYENIVRRTQHTFSSLVPGARYTVVVQGLGGQSGDRSQHVTRKDVETMESSEAT